ncbi:YeeE/YedE thiosulfate transporter family protein [Sulfurimonas sp.]
MKRRLPWWLGGILMALLLLFTFSIFGGNRPLGASTYVPFYAGILFGMNPDNYPYLKIVENAGAWEGVMLLGTFLGGLVTSIFITKSFRFSLMPTGWKVYKNNSILSRLIWSFVAGFILIIGARLAGGCTSGHFLSGMSQTAFSSIIFGGTVLVALIVTGKLFYKGEPK